MKQARVFISATSLDLKVCRQVVERALLDAGVFPVSQEHFAADNRSLGTYLRHEIATCDAVVCLVGTTFGATAVEEPGQLPRSYTHLEYETAHSLQRAVCVFLTSATDWPAGDRFNTADQEQAQQDHRRRLLKHHKCEYFDHPEDLDRKFRNLLARGWPDRRGLEMFYLHPPKPPCYFVGRQDECAQLARALCQDIPSVVVVLGMGGQGKTTLVAEWLRNHRGLPYAAGFWCTAYRDGFTFDMFLDELLIHLLREAFDKRQLPRVEQRVTRLLATLQQHPVLLVIDGFERWLKAGQHGSIGTSAAVESIEEREGAEAGLDEFLRQVSGLDNGTHLVLTSRAMPTALEDAAHTVVPVYPELERGRALRGLEPEAAADLLRHMGVQATAEELDQVVRSFGCHPLALTVLGVLVTRKHGGLLNRFTARLASEPRRELATLLDEIQQGLSLCAGFQGYPPARGKPISRAQRGSGRRGGWPGETLASQAQASTHGRIQLEFNVDSARFNRTVSDDDLRIDRKLTICPQQPRRSWPGTAAAIGPV